MSVFNASVLLLTMNFVITLSIVSCIPKVNGWGTQTLFMPNNTRLSTQYFPCQPKDKSGSVHTSTPEKFENATITNHFGFVFEKTSVREITWLSWRHCYEKAPFSKRSLHSKLQSPHFQKASVYVKLRFGDRYVRAIGLTVESNFSGAVSTSFPGLGIGAVWTGA